MSKIEAINTARYLLNEEADELEKFLDQPIHSDQDPAPSRAISAILREVRRFREADVVLKEMGIVEEQVGRPG